MRDRYRFWVALAVAWGYIVAVVAATILLLGADLDDRERALLGPVMREHVASVIVVAALAILPLALALRVLWRRHVSAPRQLAEDARIMLAANPSHRAPARGSAGTMRLAEGINRLADARESLQQDVERRVREANARIEQEKNRLAALMSELTQSVIMCNSDGRILLYNARALQLLRQPQQGASAAGSAHALVGLGRSVFGIFDRNLIIHALDSIHDRLRRDVESPVATFVTTAPAGQLVRVQIAPVFGAVSDAAADGTAAGAAEGVAAGAAEGVAAPAAEGMAAAAAERMAAAAAEGMDAAAAEGMAAAAAQGAAETMTGFVLVLDNITRRIEAGNRRDLLLQTLTQGTRASLASMRAAVETIASFPEMDRDAQDRFIGIIGEEAQRLSTRLDQTVGEFADSLRTEWPLEDMRGADLIAAARRRIETKLGLPTKLEAVDESIWLKVDSYSLMQAITYLVHRLRDEFGIREIRFGLQGEGPLAHLDLIWTGAPLGFETTMAWQSDSLELGGETCPLTLQQIIERHNGEIWYQIHKPSQREYFRIAIPVTQPEDAAFRAPPAADSRPEFYDFDLFNQAGQTPEQDNRPLTALNYTVFDTETTGLRPSEGDEIVSIGAVRIVNGRLLEHEVFEQLVDPRRAMSPDASRITGIDDATLADQPTIGQVLPAFRQFCEDTVLVAHNAAFDMRFLRLKEEATGVRFTQPVLDTLLLSAVIHPDLDAHRLEAIAARMGVRPIGRHTALGDAIMTAEVFQRMIPLLAEQGVRTLGEAREASQKTYFARIEY